MTRIGLILVKNLEEQCFTNFDNFSKHCSVRNTFSLIKSYCQTHWARMTTFWAFLLSRWQRWIVEKINVIRFVWAEWCMNVEDFWFTQSLVKYSENICKLVAVYPLCHQLWWGKVIINKTIVLTQIFIH